MNARLHVSGGALGGGRMVEDSSSVAGLYKFSYTRAFIPQHAVDKSFGRVFYCESFDR